MWHRWIKQRMKQQSKQWIDGSDASSAETSRIRAGAMVHVSFYRNFHNLLQTSGVDLCYNEFVPNAKSDTWSIWCISPKRARPWGQRFANGDAETGNMKSLWCGNEQSKKFMILQKYFFIFEIHIWTFCFEKTWNSLQNKGILRNNLFCFPWYFTKGMSWQTFFFMIQ